MSNRLGICFVPITGTLEFILITGFENRILRLSNEEFGYFIKDCYENMKYKKVIETNKYRIEDGNVYTYTKHILNNDKKTLGILLEFYKENQAKISTSSLQEEIQNIIKDMGK